MTTLMYEKHIIPYISMCCVNMAMEHPINYGYFYLFRLKFYETLNLLFRNFHEIQKEV